MKKTLFLFWPILFTFCIINSKANIILQDDFESYQTEAWPSTQWNLVNATDFASNKITNDPQNSNNQVLKLYGAGAAFAMASCTFTDDFFISTSIYNGSDPRAGTWGRGSIGLRNGLNYNSGRTLFNFYADGTVWGLDGKGGADSCFGTYNTEQWYDIKIHYQRNNSNLTLTYWIDDQLIKQQSTTIDTGMILNSFELGAGCTVYFDNVLIIPEPTTISLLCLCLIALRKKK